MKRVFVTLVTIGLASLVAGTASLASAAGLNLGWNDCPSGVSYQLNNAFACNTNLGIQIMVGSYIPPPGLDAVYGNEVVLNLTTNQATLSPWWSMGSGGCVGRTTTPAAVFDFTAGPFGCTDFWQGQAVGGLDYTRQFDGPNRARIRVICAVQDVFAGPQSPPTEYYSFKVVINDARTVGSGSCAGCTDAACIVLNSIKIDQVSPATFNPTVTNPATSNFVTWRGGTGVCPGATAARNVTWSSIKALYR